MLHRGVYAALVALALAGCGGKANEGNAGNAGNAQSVPTVTVQALRGDPPAWNGKLVRVVGAIVTADIHSDPRTSDTWELADDRSAYDAYWDSPAENRATANKPFTVLVQPVLPGHHVTQNAAVTGTFNALTNTLESKAITLQ